MGQLVERQIPTLFGGVSRQPSMVRRPNQLQNQVNALSSVVSGGFEKRPATQNLGALVGLDITKEYAVHAIDRDSTEQTFILLADGEILAFNAITGAAKTVTIGDSVHYHVIEAADIDATGVLEIGGVDFEEQLAFDSAETTFDWSWKLSDATTGRFRVEGSADGAVWNTIAGGTPLGGAASGTFSTTIDAVAAGDHNYIRVFITTGMATAADTLTLSATFQDKTYLFTGVTGPEDFAFVTVADFTFIANRTVLTRMAEADSGTITGVARTTTVGTVPAGIPAPSGTGNIYKIVEDGNEFTSFYVQDDTADNVYYEVADPTAHNAIDASTMPHQLVRNADGTLTFSAAAYLPRAAGDETLTPEPSFIGKACRDVVFFRNRLGLLADETSFLGRTAAALNMWPAKAITTLDTDPIDRSATSTDVNILQWGAVFRKLLFATSDRAQFELASVDRFTPDTASFDQATTYRASTLAKPRAMGDVLYFAAVDAEHALMYEYSYDDSALSNTAVDVTKHVDDFIPNDVISIQTDSTTGTVFVLTSGEQNAIYVYRTFFDSNEKIMSSWSKYTFGASESAAFIHGMAVFSGFLVMIIERFDGSIYLEQMPIEREAADPDMLYIPLIDQRELGTAVYDSTNDVSTWTPTWEHLDDAEVCLGPGAVADDVGRRMSLLYPDQYILTLATVLAGEIITINGLDFTAHATTTTTANREFSISGNDIADAGELTTVLNDATDGLLTVTAVDNGDATITLTVDDAADGTITAPTGTAITNATIVAVEVDQLIAARGDHSADDAYLGRVYTKTAELSKLWMRENDDAAAIISGRLQIRDITFNYEETGYFRVEVTPILRDVDTYEFNGRVIGDDDNVIGAAAIDDEGSFRAGVLTNGETGTIKVVNDTPFPSVITAASWRGFFNEISRQG